MNLSNFCKDNSLNPSVLKVYETEAEQLEAVKHDVDAIKFIKNPF